MVDVNKARERSQLVARIKQLVEEGNSLCTKGVTHHVEEKYQELVKAGQAKLQEAGALRDEFWKKYPNALVMHNCPWLAKEIKFGNGGY